MIATALFVAATAVVVAVGPRMARTADELGNATGMGSGLFGVVFLSLATDLPEITLTPAAVLGGTPHIAVGNLLGSAAAQLALLALVDIAFRRRTMYGAVALEPTIRQAALMLTVLSVPLVLAVPTPAVGPVSSGTVVMPAAYLVVLAAIRRPADPPAGGAAVDDATPIPDGSAGGASTAQRDAQGHRRALWRRFAGYAVLLAGAGVALESATERIGSSIGLGETAAGALVAGVVTSLPELVTAGAAARAGALELAVGNVIGSSALDVALLGWADAFYLDGSVFNLLGPSDFSLVGVALALTALAVLGVARAGTARSGRVALESYVMLGVYVFGVASLVAAG
jgi:cation:H+ antiporter